MLFGLFIAVLCHFFRYPDTLGLWRPTLAKNRKKEPNAKFND